MKPSGLSPLRLAVHIVGIFPLLWIAWDGFTGNLSINPIQEIIQRLGRAAVYFLIVSLACTPLNTLFGWRQALKHRRTLGLYAFGYAMLHFLMFIGVDYGFNLKEISRQIIEKPFITLGSLSFLILLALAVTSFDSSKRKLGKNWKRLHRSVYLAGILVLIHFAWARKGNLATLSGDILLPALLLLLVILLLVLRLPPVRKRISTLRRN